jgi:hypothetical protein
MPRMPEPNTEPDTRKPYFRPEVVELGTVDNETQFSFAAPGPDPRGRDIEH